MDLIRPNADFDDQILHDDFVYDKLLSSISNDFGKNSLRQYNNYQMKLIRKSTRIPFRQKFQTQRNQACNHHRKQFGNYKEPRIQSILLLSWKCYSLLQSQLSRRPRYFSLQYGAAPATLISEKPSAFPSKLVGLSFRMAFKYKTVKEWLYFSAAKNRYCCKYFEHFLEATTFSL